MDNILQCFDDLKKTEVDEKIISAFSDNDQFLEVTLNLFRELNAHIKCLGLLVPEKTGRWEIKQAVLGGQIIRLYKLNCAIYEQALENRLEICYILSRLVYETVVNLRFLIKKPDLCNNFIAFSLKPEKKLRDNIIKNIKNNKGEIKPIEKRMLDSIKFDFDCAGISVQEYTNQLSDKWVYKDINKKQKWTFSNKLEEIGINQDAYEAIFGLPSHSVHGDWQDSLRFNLDIYDGNLFGPNFDWHKPAVQLFEGLIHVLSDGCNEYLKWILPSNSIEDGYGKIEEIRDKIKLICKHHERFISQPHENSQLN